MAKICRVAFSSYLARELPILLERSCAANVKVVGQVLKVDALGALLTRLHADQRDRDFSCADLADELRRIEMREVVAANILDRDHRLAAVLRHKQEGGVEGGGVGGCFVHEIDASSTHRRLKLFWSPYGRARGRHSPSAPPIRPGRYACMTVSAGRVIRRSGS